MTHVHGPVPARTEGAQAEQQQPERPRDGAPSFSRTLYQRPLLRRSIASGLEHDLD